MRIFRPFWLQMLICLLMGRSCFLAAAGCIHLGSGAKNESDDGGSCWHLWIVTAHYDSARIADGSCECARFC